MQSKNPRRCRWHRAEQRWEQKEESLGTARETTEQKSNKHQRDCVHQAWHGDSPRPLRRLRGKPSEPQPPQTYALPAWGHPINFQELNMVVRKRKSKPRNTPKNTVKMMLSAHKIVFLFALLPSAVEVTGRAWSWSSQALSWYRNSTIWISSGPELAFTRLNRCVPLAWRVSVALAQVEVTTPW